MRMNAWVAGIIKYGNEVLDWTRKQLKSIDIKTRKLVTIYGSLHLKGNVVRLYLARKEGGRGFISCEEYVNVKVQSLDKHLTESKELVLKFVAEEKCLSEEEDLDAFKKGLKEEKPSQWL